MLKFFLILLFIIILSKLFFPDNRFKEPENPCWRTIYKSKDIGFYLDECSIRSVGKNKINVWLKTEYLTKKYLTNATKVITQKYLDCSNNKMADVQDFSYWNERLIEKNTEENVEFRDSPSISSKKPYKDIFAFACK